MHLVECFTSTENVESYDLHRVVRGTLGGTLNVVGLGNEENGLRLQMVTMHMWLAYIEFLEERMEKDAQMEPILEEILSERMVWDKILEIYQFRGYGFL